MAERMMWTKMIADSQSHNAKCLNLLNLTKKSYVNGSKNVKLPFVLSLEISTLCGKQLPYSTQTLIEL
jgi:hypothetical protein